MFQFNRPVGVAILFAIAFAAAPVTALAQTSAPIEWKVSDGGNGHWYKLVIAPNTVSWSDADAAAALLSAHLATLTSANENAFVFAVANQPGAWGSVWPDYSAGPWLGAFRDSGTSAWRWVTGETWSWTNWLPPNPDGPGFWNENRLSFATNYSSQWNDFNESGSQPCCKVVSYVLEFDADCNGDGIVDYGQILSGALVDSDINGVPDCCQAGVDCVTILEGPILWPSNGHTYYLLSQSNWEAAELRASQLTGHLVTVNNQSENDFLLTSFGDKAENAPGTGSNVSLWIGLSDAANEGQFIWAGGSSSTFTNYAPGEPAGGQADEDYIGISITPNPSWKGKWHDIVADHRFSDRCYGVVEINYAIRVPADFSTIQAAIDSVQLGETKEIEVAPGTYNEAIDFKGKAITVKATGARASTIIDGTGLTTSVVRAVTGETSATVLQGFTILNGPIGSASGTYRLGGGMFISNASPTIRNCAFTANQSAYGGGMYALYSNSLVENCTFSQNSGSADGGGVQLVGGSPIVRNCDVSDNTAGNRGGGFHVVQYNTGAAQMDGCTISGNRSNVSDGGGISMAPLAGAAQKFLVSNCQITNNFAQARGGGVWAVVDPANPQQNVTLSGNTICNNTSAISKRENVWALFEDGGNTICDCISDINGDRATNSADLGIMLGYFGTITDPDFIQPDQDMNGKIDSADLGSLLSNFGDCAANLQSPDYNAIDKLNREPEVFEDPIKNTTDILENSMDAIEFPANALEPVAVKHKS